MSDMTQYEIENLVLHRENIISLKPTIRFSSFEICLSGQENVFSLIRSMYGWVCIFNLCGTLHNVTNINHALRQVRTLFLTMLNVFLSSLNV